MKCGRNKGQRRVNREEQPEVIPGFPLGLSKRQIESWKDRISVVCAVKDKKLAPQADKWHVSISKEL